MLPFKLVYSPDYFLPIGDHVFPAVKYRMIAERLRQAGIAGQNDFLEPGPASDDEVRLAHTAEYVAKIREGRVSLMEERILEVPFSPELVKAFWLSAGGSMLAAEHALADGMCVNIGGGFHHAGPDHGEGFCLINDVAIAVRKLRQTGSIQSAMVFDCDVHHGNGTASIFPSVPKDATEHPTTRMRQAEPRDASVFTVSLHQWNNYPALKPPSCIDVDFADGVADDEYLVWLSRALDQAFARTTPEMLFYIAGADPYKEDQLGGLALTLAGLKQRDEMVFAAAKSRQVPVMVTFAGGYARRVNDTVEIHCNTVRAAAEIFTR